MDQLVTYLQDITENKMAGKVTVYLNSKTGELVVERNTDIFLSGLSKHAEPMLVGKNGAQTPICNSLQI